MKTISLKSVLEKIEKNEINVLGFVTTPWHYIGMQAFIERIKGDDKYDGHLIVVGKHPQNGYVLNANLPNCYYLDCEEFPILKENAFFKLRYLLQSQSHSDTIPLYIVSAWNYRLETSIYIFKYTYRKCILCKIDEGVATYMFTSNSLYEAVHCANVKLFMRYVGSKLFHLLLKGDMNCNLLEMKNGRLCPNNEIIPYYRSVLNVDNTEVRTVSKDIVIATMAFPENEVFHNELTVKTRKLVDFLSNEGFNVIIKPHPREVCIKEKYVGFNCSIANKLQSMEEFLVNYRPHAIISFSSTCLITAELFYNIRSISLTNILNLNNFSKKYRNELTTFRDTFSDVVKYPNSMKELKVML